MRADVSTPEAPREAEPRKDDCAWERRPSEGGAAIARVVGPIVAWDPTEEPRVSGWFPRCLAYQTDERLVMGAYASYDVGSGRYYVHAPVRAPGAVEALLPPSRQAATVEATGTTGVGLLADCELCPPPGST